MSPGMLHPRIMRIRIERTASGTAASNVVGMKIASRLAFGCLILGVPLAACGGNGTTSGTASIGACGAPSGQVALSYPAPNSTGIPDNIQGIVFAASSGLSGTYQALVVPAGSSQGTAFERVRDRAVAASLAERDADRERGVPGERERRPDPPRGDDGLRLPQRQRVHVYAVAARLVHHAVIGVAPVAIV